VEDIVCGKEDDAQTDEKDCESVDWSREIKNEKLPFINAPRLEEC